MPASPSTVTRWPSRRRSVAFRVATTAGIRYSRAMIAGWERMPPVSVTSALGIGVTLDEGSTDSNVAMSLKIPAVTIDGGGRGTGSHSLEETFDTTNAWQGAQRALLLAVALAQ